MNYTMLVRCRQIGGEKTAIIFGVSKKSPRVVVNRSISECEFQIQKKDISREEMADVKRALEEKQFKATDLVLNIFLMLGLIKKIEGDYLNKVHKLLDSFSNDELDNITFNPDLIISLGKCKGSSVDIIRDNWEKHLNTLSILELKSIDLSQELIDCLENMEGSGVDFLKHKWENLNSKCPICYEKMYLPSDEWKCGHSICISCCIGMIGTKAYRNCPMCREDKT